MIPLLNSIDAHWLITINHLSGNLYVDFFMTWVSSWITWTTLGCVLLFFAILKKRRELTDAIVISLIAISITDVISFEIVKPLVHRERPCWELEGVYRVLGGCGGSYGFTSNHAANAMAAASVFLILQVGRGWSLLALVCASVIGFSRIYLGVHYPGDVFGGFVLGYLISLTLKKIGVFDRIRRLGR